MVGETPHESTTGINDGGMIIMSLHVKVPAIATNKGGDEVVNRMEEDVVGSPSLRDLGFPSQDKHLVAEQECLVNVMGDEDDRLP